MLPKSRKDPVILESLGLAGREVYDIRSRCGEASALANSGMTYVALGDYVAAESLLHQSLAIQEDIGDQSGLPDGLTHLARALADLGQLDEALATAQRALEAARHIGDRSCQVIAMNVVAWQRLIKQNQSLH